MKIILRNTKLEFQAGTFEVDEYISSQTTVENPEFKSVIVDNEDKILWGRYIDDTTTDIDLSGETIDGVSVERIINATIFKYNL